MAQNSILLHACCGICSGYPIVQLQENGYVPVVYFYNPNIDNYDEFQRRLDAQICVCEKMSVNYIVEKYNHDEFLEMIKDYENEPERGFRCNLCIKLRMEKTAKKAKDLGYSIFTTSLGISPHKDFDMITKIGVESGEKYNLKFLSVNFRKKDGFLKTNNIANSLNLYRQNYCGCEFAKSHILTNIQT